MREVFEGGLISTDAEEECWYSLPLGELKIGMARDEEGTGVVFVRVQAPQEAKTAVAVVLHACASYDLK